MKFRLTIFTTLILSIFCTLAVAQDSDPGFEVISLWEGLTADKIKVKEGEQSGRWSDTVTTTRIYTEKGFPRDLSSYEGFKVWVYSETVTEAKIAFVFFSDNEATEGDDFYVHAFPVDWTGWKQIDVPFIGLHEIRTPLGLSNISEVRFASEGFTVGDPSPDTRLNFDGIEFYGANRQPVNSQGKMTLGNLKWENSITEAISVARKENKLIFIASFEKNGSSYSEVESLSNRSLVQEELKNFSLFAFDPNEDKNNANFFNIQKVPTLLVFKPNGEELLRMTDIPDANSIANFLKIMNENNS